MYDNFNRNFVISVVLILGLLALDRAPVLMGRGEERRRLEKVLLEMHNGDLNREDFDALAAGYYEGLRRDTTPGGMPSERDDIRFRDDFLRYELKPDVRRRYAAGMRITNSLGMPNPEYGYEKPPHTRRIALLGDSISLGPYGHDYGALLEDRLNRADVTPETRRFQVLNFAVYGYRVVQTMDVALEVVPKFHPDVYMVALSGLEANKRASWSGHIARLKLEGTDLKYAFLRQIAAEAGLQPTDHYATMLRKLEPFHLQVTRWALEMIRDHAASEGAQMVIVLVPAPTNPDIIATAFDEIRPAVDGIGVPVIDLRDAFRSEKLDDLQVIPGIDIHPNMRGHEILFESLYQKIQQDPKFAASLLGISLEPEGSVARSR